MRELSPKLLKVLADPRVAAVDDERDDDQGIWVYLVPGYWSPEMECHTVHEYNVADVMAKVAGLKPCDCAYCRLHLEIDGGDALPRSE